MHQLQLPHLPGGNIQNRHLLKAGMKITSYNLHKAPLLQRQTWSPNKPSLTPDPEEPSGLFNQANGAPNAFQFGGGESKDVLLSPVPSAPYIARPLRDGRDT